MASEPVKVVFGAMTIRNGVEQSHAISLDEIKKILDIFQFYWHDKIDTNWYVASTQQWHLRRVPRRDLMARSWAGYGHQIISHGGEEYGYGRMDA